MRLSRRLRPGILVIATVTVVAAMVGLPVPKAQAFYTLPHERVIREALPPGEVDEIAILQILVGPPPGAGALGTDLLQSDEFRHVDNAVSPADICARTLQAWNFFTPIILSGSQLTGAGLTDGAGARAAFGGLSHAVADFYAHSNWVEDNVAVGQPERPAPDLMPTCNPAAFPAGLQTGYWSLQFGIEGCPPGGPPPGFRECLSTVNKDGPGTPRGAVPVPGTNMNQFDVAMRLATGDTAELYRQVRGLVASTNGEAAAGCLFQTGGAGCGDPGPVLPIDPASIGDHLT
jgi:hypothetical protein